MIKKFVGSVSVISLVLIFATVFVTQIFSKQGQHIGEQKMLDVDIQFHNSAGKTITNANGVFYHFWGYVFKENKVYPEKYWGEFPLYFFGEQVAAVVKVTNKGPRAKAKVRVKTEAYVLLTDGSSGVELTDPKIFDVEVKLGETKIINAFFVAEYRAGAESGLDRFLVKVLHLNEGGGPGNPEPALIMVKEGVFCPPEYKP